MCIRDSGDTAGTLTKATTAGFTTTAGSNESYLIEVDARDCPAGKPWVNLQAVEVVDSPVIGSIEIVLEDANYYGDTIPTAIA